MLVEAPAETEDSACTTLYRLFAENGDLLYIGVAGNPGRRFEQHRVGKSWWKRVSVIQLEHFDSRSEAEQVEMQSVREEQPLYNIVGTPMARRIYPNTRASNFISVRLPKDFYEAVKVSADHDHRSITQQLQHWRSFSVMCPEEQHLDAQQGSRYCSMDRGHNGAHFGDLEVTTTHDQGMGVVG